MTRVNQDLIKRLGLPPLNPPLQYRPTIRNRHPDTGVRSFSFFIS